MMMMMMVLTVVQLTMMVLNTAPAINTMLLDFLAC